MSRRFTQRHYEAVADLLNEATRTAAHMYDEDTVTYLMSMVIEKFCRMFEADSGVNVKGEPLFKRDLFIRRATVVDSASDAGNP